MLSSAQKKRLKLSSANQIARQASLMASSNEETIVFTRENCQNLAPSQPLMHSASDSQEGRSKTMLHWNLYTPPMALLINSIRAGVIKSMFHEAKALLNRHHMRTIRQIQSKDCHSCCLSIISPSVEPEMASMGFHVYCSSDRLVLGPLLGRRLCLLAVSSLVLRLHSSRDPPVPRTIPFHS